MTESDAAFDRALGAWEDGQLNAHLAQEARWEAASAKADLVVWHTTLRELYEMTPVGVERKIEEVADNMIDHVTELILEGRWDGCAYASAPCR